MAIVKPDIIHDAGKVAADGSRIAGCISGVPAEGATGVYTYTLRAGSSLDTTEGAFLVAPQTAGLYATAVTSTDVLTTVNLKDAAGADTDGIWSFVYLNLA